ncbi:dTDP-4-dehydrorhamnose 3,5-epimerase [Megalodesulfovibrio gigas]|uniref:dTDP-4-dehydrorhamnose 3,5-epimerase n=1 Tax=Megalodesulfovibrio gigas (strain ATCC 19364 / DSM 1382 / NCIMB 9332 / VKM B-1759) TaxID=1121448 RepID=T2GBA4_MEGG1|nr:dTDP-4-dehydrorhamnose 3,5-epimerase [Megalodesulfovibrio gigas]AGW13416.1 putative dTDP-4-dehydrorhamnose 3,5-epimerase [Megalodesulfovibrio gigas DSM 1382 = ATCC 19364]
MQFTPTDLPGVFLLKPKVFGDERGFFMESYNARLFAEQGLNIPFIQDNHAKSGVGVLRGLHFQRPPMAQTKLVRVTAGSVYDAVVDLRKGSPTYGQWRGFTLSAENFLQLLVPQGFAHGYVTLEPDTEFQYKVDNYYAPELDGGLRWDDPTLAIDWPVKTPNLSAKDKLLPLLSDFDSPFRFQA